MSLSQPQVSVSSPIKRYYTWSGAEGTLKYYDTTTKENNLHKGPFKFILIDDFSLVAGYSAKVEQGFRSNEVKKTQSEELIVRWNGGRILVQGLYTDIKSTVEDNGGTYLKSLYGVTEIDGKLELINLQFKKSAMTSWINFDKSSKMTKEGLEISIGKSNPLKKGTVTYYTPIFRANNPTEADLLTATEKDIELQSYISGRGVQPTQLPVGVEGGEMTAEEKAKLVKPKKAEVHVEPEIIESSEDDFFSDL